MTMRASKKEHFACCACGRASSIFRSILTAARQLIGWHVPLVILPVMLLRSRCYPLYFGRATEVPLAAIARAADA